MRNRFLVYTCAALACSAGCFIGGFYGGIIFGITTTLVTLSTIGRWQYIKAARLRDDHMNKLITTLKKIGDDGATDAGSQRASTKKLQ